MGIYIGQRRPDPRALAASRMHPQTLADLLTNPYGYPLPGDPPPAGGQRRTPQVGSNVIPPYQPVPQPQPPVPPQPPQRPADPWQGMRDVGGFRGNDVLGGGEDPLAAAAPAAPQAPQAPQRPAGLLGKLTTPDETIMGLAAGLLDAGRWSTTPINMSEALGAGVKGAMAGKQLKQERKEREDILAFKKRAEDFEQRRIAQWEKLISGGGSKGGVIADLSPDERALLATMTPEQGAQLLAAKSMRNGPTDSAAEEKIARLIGSGIPREIAIGIADGRLVESRDDTGRAIIIDKATGRPFDYGGTGGAAPSQPTAPAAPAPSGTGSNIPPGFDIDRATGIGGVVSGSINLITDFLTGKSYDKVSAETATAMDNLKARTLTVMQEPIAGRASNQVMDQLEKYTVAPNTSVGPDRTRTIYSQTAAMLETEINRIQKDILDNPGAFKFDEVQKAKMNQDALRSLLKDYRTALGSGESSRPPLESFRK